METLVFSSSFSLHMENMVHRDPIEILSGISKRFYGIMGDSSKLNLKTTELTPETSSLSDLYGTESLPESLEKLEKINVRNLGVNHEFSHRLSKVFLQRLGGLWSFTAVSCEIQFSYLHVHVKTTVRLEGATKNIGGTVTVTDAWNNNTNSGGVVTPCDSLGNFWEPFKIHGVPRGNPSKRVCQLWAEEGLR